MAGFKRKSPAQLAAQLESVSGKKDYSNADEWKLTTDKAGNGSAIIRFLPGKDEDSLPFVKMFTHGFKENGNWFIENCPSTIGQECPVCQANGELWNTEIKENQDLARKRKRTLSYWANIVVIKDEANPDSVGKVFKYRLGQKILEKVTQAAQADEDLGTTGIDATCVFEGANFLLKAKKVSGFPNYDDSKFGTQTELFDGDEAKLGEVWEAMHDLNKITAPAEFKGEADLLKRFLQVTGQEKKATNAAANLKAQLDSPSKPAEKAAAPKTVKPKDDIEIDTSSDDVDDELDALLADLENDLD